MAAHPGRTWKGPSTRLNRSPPFPTGDYGRLAPQSLKTAASENVVASAKVPAMRDKISSMGEASGTERRRFLMNVPVHGRLPTAEC